MKTNGYQLKACIGNYGYYAAGQLRDKWVTLPMADDELAAWLKGNGLSDPAHEETYVSDYDGAPFGVDASMLEYAGAFELNALAKAMDDAAPWELDAAQAAIDSGAAEPRNIDELINLVMQADEIGYAELPEYGCAMSAEERLGYSYAEETGFLAELEKIGADSYFDFERYGRDLAMDLFLAPDCYVYDVPALDYYDADDIRDMSESWDAAREAKAAA